MVLGLVARYTTWGRQFWRITGDYFKGRESIPVWALLGVLMLLVMIDVRSSCCSPIRATISSRRCRPPSKAKDRRKHCCNTWVLGGDLDSRSALSRPRSCRTLLDMYLMQRFIIRWRVWLTQRLTSDWLDGDAYYRGRFIERPIDNPDQRIQQDIDVFTTGTGPETNTLNVRTAQTLLFGTVFAIVSVVEFTPILWGLSGPLTLFGFTLPKALFWMALVYVFFTTVVAFWIGHPLIRLSFRNEHTNAAIPLCAGAAARCRPSPIGLYRGEGRRTRRADDQVRRRHRQLPGIRPAQHRVPRLEPIDERDRRPAPDGHPGAPAVRPVRSNSATSPSRRARSAASHDSLSFFRNVYDAFAGYRAAIIRLDGLVDANETARELPSLTAVPSTDGSTRARRRRGPHASGDAAHRPARRAARSRASRW